MFSNRLLHAVAVVALSVTAVAVGAAAFIAADVLTVNWPTGGES